MKNVALAAMPVLLLMAVACGSYRSEADATAEARDRLVASQSCDGVFPIDNDDPPPGLAPPTPYFPNGSPTPNGQPSPTFEPSLADETAVVTAAPCDIQGCTLSLDLRGGSRAVLVDPSGRASSDDPTATATATPSPMPIEPCNSSHTPLTASPTVEVVLAITSTSAPSETPTPTSTPETSTPLPTGTSAVATQTAQASRQAAYLSIGDGIQWGCCGNLGLASSSLFADYLTARLGRPVFWQTSGSGYHTTGTFMNDGTQQSQMAFALELIEYYRRDGIPLAAITMSIGGNNLVEIGRNCAAPPCVEAFAQGLTQLREDLDYIYSRISTAKDANTPLLVLLYYDANECTGDSTSGGAVDAWNAVIAEVATAHGAFLVDARTLFKGHCDWFDANGLDANTAGHAAIASEYQRVYDALPPQYHLAP